MILSNFPTKTITPESIGAIPNPTGGTAGQVLTKTADGSSWEDAPSGLPEGGTEGQVIKKTADGAEWDDAEWLPLSGGAMSGDINMADPTSDYDPSITANGIKNYTSPWIQWSVGDPGKHDLRIGTDGGYMRFAPESDGGACLLTISAQYGLSMSGDQIRNLGDPTEPQGAATKQYVDTQLSTKLTQEVADTRYLQLGGGTINGTLKFNNGMGEENYASIYSDKSAMFIDIPGGEVYIGSAGRSDDIVVTRGYIDDVLSGYLPLSGGTLTGDIHIKSNASDEESDYAWIYNEKGTLTLESASGYVDLHVKTPIYDDQPANKAYVDSHPVYHAGTSAPSNTNLLWIDTNATTGGLKYYNGSSWVHVPVAYS